MKKWLPYLLASCIFTFGSLVDAVAGVLVVLDPGHGGDEPGAQTAYLREADIALDIATRMKNKLESANFEVLMTRSDDTTVPLLDRAKIANEAEADVFVSIHVNAAESKDLHGIETYSVDIATDGYSEMLALKENSGVFLNMEEVPTITTSRLLLSMELSELVQSSIMSEINKTYQNNTIQNLGHKTAMFTVLVKAEMPAILMEVGFMSNPEELKHLESAHYRDTVSSALTKALIEWRERNNEQ